jgi:F-type H+-transporting ATPase subunit epsilon
MAEELKSASGKRLKCVVVTPEEAVLDEPADFVALPMYDGELGVLPGRAPLIGRLGFGELRVRRGDKVELFYVDGGFAQVRADVVTVLTGKAVPGAAVSATAAQQALERALAPAGGQAVDVQLKQQAQARAQLRVARHAEKAAPAHEHH